MTAPAANPSRRLGRSIGAIAAGFVAVFILSLGTDQLLHVLNVYPPWSEPMHEPWLNLLALSYRLVYGVIGGYIMAALAPHSPMRHAITGGTIGLVLSSIGVIASIRMNMGPAWYPILLALSAIPTSWLGAELHRNRS